jgi:hypothetical protein
MAMMAKTIVLPYKPRFPQTLIHPELESHRFNVLVAHRRLGKTVMSINHMLKMALQNPYNDPLYAYVAPYLKQAKLISWAYMKRFTAPIPNIKVNESDLMITLPNGARMGLFGADNPDALRGPYLDGVVLDEYAQIKSEVFNEILRPELSDRNGWALFAGTPKGQNQFLEVHQQAMRNMEAGDPEWWTGVYRVDETNIIPETELASIRKVLTETQYRQEYLCDFTASMDNILIPIDMVLNSYKRIYTERDVAGMPRLLGVDVARFGDDRSVIARRWGHIAYEPLVYRGLDNMQLVGKVTEAIRDFGADATFIDSGRGEGVIDRLRQLGYKRIIEVDSSSTPNNDHYANKRAEMWHEFADWVDSVGLLPSSTELKNDITVVTYKFDKHNRILIESKENIKKIYGKSTDVGDAYALTFAQRVMAQAAVNSRQRFARPEGYNILKGR